MNQQIIDYLNQNKDKFPQEELINQLRKSGYQENEIQEGISIVYGVDKKNVSTRNFLISLLFFFVTAFLLIIIFSMGGYVLNESDQLLSLLLAPLLPSATGALLYAAMLHLSKKAVSIIAITIFILSLVSAFALAALNGSGLFLIFIMVPALVTIFASLAVAKLARATIYKNTNDTKRLVSLFVIPVILLIFIFIKTPSQVNTSSEDCTGKNSNKYLCYARYAEKNDEPIWCYLARNEMLIKETWNPYCKINFREEFVDPSDCDELSGHIRDREIKNCKSNVEEWDMSPF